MFFNKVAPLLPSATVIALPSFSPVAHAMSGAAEHVLI